MKVIRNSVWSGRNSDITRSRRSTRRKCRTISEYNSRTIWALRRFVPPRRASAA